MPYDKEQIFNFTIPTLHGCDSRDGTSDTRLLSEFGNALRLQDNLRNDIHYVYETKIWLHWELDKWIWCFDGAKVHYQAAKLHKQIYNEGQSNPADAKLFASWSRSSQKEKIINASVSLLKNFKHLRLPLSSIDAGIFHVGINNAVKLIDLKTGFSRPVKREDYITKTLNVDYLGKSTNAVIWLSFLEQVFEGDQELINWLKRWCGYLLTGSTTEHLLVFCYGLGANGKSVFAETLTYILGDYARAIASETLTDSKRSAGGASPDIADLIGARLALSSETEGDKALAESLVKSLVSGDSMTARKLYSQPIQFNPQFKLMILGNHKPNITGNDHGIWRRIRLVPFKRTFKENERDLMLLDKLRAEAPHILAWMVEGCLEWQNQGLSDTPVVIEEATSEYKEEQDLIGLWLSECCNLSLNDETSSAKLFISYKNWCSINGIKQMSSIAFGKSLGQRNYKYRKSSGNNIWAGIALKAA
jgi:P4 family phage/plasmid primase-like protien